MLGPWNRHDRIKIGPVERRFTMGALDHGVTAVVRTNGQPGPQSSGGLSATRDHDCTDAREQHPQGQLGAAVTP